MQQNLSGRIPSLDGLRAISILLVLFGHLAGTVAFPVQSEFLNLSNMGVRIFFVISGFLITGILLAELDRTDTIDLKKFYYRRTLRIFPPYYAFLAVVGILSLWGVFAVPLFDWLSAVFYVTNFAEVTSWDIGHTWSLAVEEQFYLIMPAVLLLGRKWAVRILLAVVIFAPFIRLILFTFHPFPGDRWVDMGFQANADSLATGCLLALFKGDLDTSRIHSKIQNSPLFLVFPLIAVGLNSFAGRPRIFMFFCITPINISIVLCIDWLVRNHATLIGRIFNLRPLAYVGTLSYSLYLWQQIFLNRNANGVTTSFPLNIVLACLVALLSFYLVEKPFLKLRQRLEPHFFGKKISTDEVSRGQTEAV